MLIKQILSLKMCFSSDFIEEYWNDLVNFWRVRTEEKGNECLASMFKMINQNQSNKNNSRILVVLFPIYQYFISNNIAICQSVAKVIKMNFNDEDLYSQYIFGNQLKILEKVGVTQNSKTNDQQFIDSVHLYFRKIEK